MYVAIRIIGSSNKGYFRSDADHKKMVNHMLHMKKCRLYVSRLFASSNPNMICSQGVDYKDDTGFSSDAGNSFDMPIYYTDDKIKGKNPIKIAFQNFAITD